MFAWRDNYISYNGASANDPYWNDVSLLLNYETPQTAFTDGSTINALVTVAAGNPRPNLRTPFASGAGASIYFSGAASTWLTAPANADYAFDTGDFTVELWYYRTVAAGASAIAGSWTGQASSPFFTPASSAWLLTQGNSNSANIRWASCNGTSAAFVESSACIVNNTWGHIAISRSSGVMKMFYNGTQVYSAANTTNMSPTTGQLNIMAVATGSPNYISTGFISNLRIVKGTAVYTAAFTPPTAPLTAISGTSFLLNCTNQGTPNSSIVLDQSTTASLLTLVNSPTFSGLSPFFTAAPNTYPGSIRFNGTNQYVLNSTAGGVPSGTGAYTVEGWIRFNSFTVGTNQTFIDSIRVGNGGFFMGTGISYGGSNNGFRIGKSFVADCEYCNFTFALNTWYHIANVRSGTTIYFFVNGVQQTTQAGSQSTGSYSWPGATTTRWGFGANGLHPVNGNMSNWRIVNGTALYTSNFTPPTNPLTAVTNTVMLMSHQTTGLYDVSNNGNPLLSNQTTQTSIYKYGTQGGLTTTGITTVTDATNLQFSTGDFTIEGWIYRNAAGVVGGIISKGTSTTGWRVRVNASNQLVFAVTAADVQTSTTTIPATTWTYFAWTRSGSTNYMFINGTQEGSTFSDSTNFNQTNNLLVGSDGVNTTLQGYMDEVRLTKGVARYTASFSAPSSAFPTS